MFQCIVHIENLQQNFQKIKAKGQEKSCFLTLEFWIFQQVVRRRLKGYKKVFRELHEGT